MTGSDRQGVEWNREGVKARALSADTLCIVMGMRRIEEITSALIEGGRAAETPAAVIQWGARPRQHVVVAPLVSIASRARAAGLANPALIVVGDVVSLRDKLRWYDTRPLFGRRLLIPRASEQAPDTAAMIRARSAEPVCAPAIEIHPPPDPHRLRDAIQELGTYDWVVFTSANGVLRCFAMLESMDLDARAFGSTRIAVIGPKTAACLRRFGLKPDAVAQQYVGEAVADAILAREQGKRILILRALEARTALPDILTRAGATVDVVAAYETKPVRGKALDSLVECCSPERVDTVLFTSSSTVSSVMEALGEGGKSLLNQLTIASIGPITTQTAHDLGLRVDVTATEYTVEGLLDALEAHAISAC